MCDTVDINMNKYDVIIIGAGAAGLSAARSALMREKSVAILEMGRKAGRKISVSGGGRCNITNAAVDCNRYFGMNPDFVRGALSRLTPQDVLNWANSHRLVITEKNPGQYFCANGATAVLDALMQDTQKADMFYNSYVTQVHKQNDLFLIQVNNQTFYAKSVIVATGGISFESLGVSDIGYKIAQFFGHDVIPVRPGLCAMDMDVFPSDWAGISLNAEITIDKKYVVTDSMLVTHVGIGGPAAYRTSVHDINDGIQINLVPGVDLGKILREYKRTNGRRTLKSILGDCLPDRVAKWATRDTLRNIADIKDTELDTIVNRVQKIYVPKSKIKYHGMSAAEVVRGGVDTRKISSKTMESLLCSGLFWAGEVLDVAGDLGGFNLHWAWASGYVAGQNA